MLRQICWPGVQLDRLRALDDRKKVEVEWFDKNIHKRR